MSPLYEVAFHLVGCQSYQFGTFLTFWHCLEHIEYFEHQSAVVAHRYAAHGVGYWFGLLQHRACLVYVEGIVDIEFELAHQCQVVPQLATE